MRIGILTGNEPVSIPMLPPCFVMPVFGLKPVRSFASRRSARTKGRQKNEQSILTVRMKRLQAAVAKESEIAANVNGFLSIVRKYTDIPELTSEIVREFIEKVYIFHPEVADGKRTQKIVIVWNCIGEFNARTLDAENEQA